MILTLLIILIGLLVWICIAIEARDGYNDDGLIIGTIFLSFFILGVFVEGVILGVNVSKERIMDEKITLYQEENNDIEQKTYDLVMEYMKFEEDIYPNITKESAITLIQLYPELKSNELIEKLLELYVENNREIRNLKEQKLNISVEKFWLYFGK